MAKKLKRMVCPECGDTQRTKKHKGYLECENCDLKFKTEGSNVYILTADNVWTKIFATQTALSDKRKDVNKTPFTQRLRNSIEYYKAVLTPKIPKKPQIPTLPKINKRNIVTYLGAASFCFFCLLMCTPLITLVGDDEEMVSSEITVNKDRSWWPNSWSIKESLSHPFIDREDIPKIFSIYTIKEESDNKRDYSYSYAGRDSVFFCFVDVVKKEAVASGFIGVYDRRNNILGERIGKETRGKMHLVIDETKLIEIDNYNMSVTDITSKLLDPIRNKGTLEKLEMDKTGQYLTLNFVGGKLYYTLHDQRMRNYASMQDAIDDLNENTLMRTNYTRKTSNKTGTIYSDKTCELKYEVRKKYHFIQIYDKEQADKLIWGEYCNREFNGANVETIVKSKDKFLIKETKPEVYIYVDTTNHIVESYYNYPVSYRAQKQENESGFSRIRIR